MALDARRLRARDLAMSRRAPTRYAVAASALPSTPTATRRRIHLWTRRSPSWNDRNGAGDDDRNSGAGRAHLGRRTSHGVAQHGDDG